MSRPIVTLDSDGVITNFLAQYEIAGRELLGRELRTIEPAYRLDARYGTTAAERAAIFQHFFDQAHWERIPECDGAVAAIQRLMDHGLEVHVVTAIDEAVLPQRLRNFRSLGIPNLPVHACPQNKLETLKRLQPLAFVDDSPLHIEEAHAAGIEHRIHIPNSPQDYHSPLATYWASSLAEAVDHLLLALGITGAIEIETI